MIDHDLNEMSERELKDFLLSCLGMIRDAADATVDEGEAIRRAQELEIEIMAKEIRPEHIELNEKSKSILYALVYRVLPAVEVSAEERERRARLVRDFIEALPWDYAYEKELLLKDCTGFALTPTARPVDPCANLSAKSRDSDPDAAFDKAWRLPGRALVDLYGFSKTEVRGLERQVRVWFTRLCRRDGSVPRNPRAVLLAMAIHLAKENRRFEQAEKDTSGDTSLDRLIRMAALALEKSSRG